MAALLFLDVDGPLLPFGMTAPPGGIPPVRLAAADGSPLLARLDPTLGPKLLALPCELVWATTWMEDANDEIGPRLGLPALPVLDWPDLPDHPAGLHWKTPGLVGCAAGRPFVWVDDEITGTDRAWVSAHHRGSSLLHRVDPAEGLTDADFTVIDEWLRLTSQVESPAEPRAAIR